MLKQKATIIKIKILLEIINSDSEQAEERISELDGETIKMIKCQGQKEKIRKMNIVQGIYGISRNRSTYILWESKK